MKNNDSSTLNWHCCTKNQERGEKSTYNPFRSHFKHVTIKILGHGTCCLPKKIRYQQMSWSSYLGKVSSLQMILLVDTKMKVALSSVPRLKHFNVSVMSSSGFFSSSDFVCYAIFFDDICPLYPILPIFSNEWLWRWWYMRAFLKTGTDLFYTFSLRVDFHCRVIFTCIRA